MRHVNRRLGRLLAAGCHVVGLTPNQVTVASGLVSVLALLLLAVVPLQPAWLVAVVALLLLGFALDSADGQLARLTHSGGPAGEWLDHVIDAFRQVLIPLTIAYVMLERTGLPLVATAVPLTLLLVTSVRFFAQILAGKLRQEAGRPEVPGDPPRRAVDLAALIQVPADVSTLYLVLLLLPWPSAFLVALSVLVVANTLLLVTTLHRRFRELRSLVR